MFFKRRFRRLMDRLMSLISIEYATKEQKWILSDLHKAKILEAEKYAQSGRLERFGFKVYSQNDEDGILHEIFNRIGTTNKFFIEFGVQDGLECNSHLLLFQGWSGIFIEGDENYCQKMNELFKLPIKQNRLKIINAFITKDNINELFLSANAPREIDLLSIDIDGNDYHIWNAIDSINPRVVVIEMNAKFPPPIKYIMPYNESHIWDGSDIQGASLQSLYELGLKLGYELVATNLNGVNAFFVRSDLIGDKFAQDRSPKNLYNKILYYGFNNSGHPSKYFLANADEN